MISKQAAILKTISESFDVPVVVTNQVTTRFGAGSKQDGALVAALGPMWAHAVNTRITLSMKQGTINIALFLNAAC